MKKLFTLLLAVVMMMSCLAGCSAPTNEGSSSTPESTIESTVESTVETTAESIVEDTGADNEKPEKITITCIDGTKDENTIQLEVPYDPQKIAVCDMAALDILVILDLQDRIVCVATTTLDYLMDAVEGIPTTTRDLKL